MHTTPLPPSGEEPYQGFAGWIHRKGLARFLFPIFLLSFIISFIVALTTENGLVFLLSLLIGIPSFFLHFKLHPTKKPEINDYGCLIAVSGISLGLLLAFLHVNAGAWILYGGMIGGIVLFVIPIFRNPEGFSHPYYAPGRPSVRARTASIA